MILEIPYQTGSLSNDLNKHLRIQFLNNENKIIRFIPFTIENNEEVALQLKNSGFIIIDANEIERFQSLNYSVIAYITKESSTVSAEISGTLLLIKGHLFNNYLWLNNLDEREKFGKVSITGFGPGDPDLLTVKALKTIQNADIIYYDDLIGKDFIEKFAATKVYVGKRKGNHSFTQDQINGFLYQSALEGKKTVRLKGGDPFIFGRGGEELEYLSKRFIEVEVIPGISAAFGAASSVGIPLTLRGVSASVAFCTGFPINLEKIPSADTLVFYMSATVINDIAAQLLVNGHSGNTPVALVRNASLIDQETIFTDLESISKGTISLASPMIAIVGEVARERNLNTKIGQFIRSDSEIGISEYQINS